MQKFNGKNIYNRVKVDFEKRTVKFTPVIGDWNEKRLFMSMYVHHAIFIFYLLMFVFGIHAIVILTRYGINEFINISYVLAILSISMAIALIMTIPFFIDTWRERCYPKYNALLVNTVSYFTNRKKKKITKDNLYKKQYIIPNFSNVELRYKLYGDFCNIKNIDIVNTDKDNPSDWFAVIEFFRIPRKGYMELVYQ